MNITSSSRSGATSFVPNAIRAETRTTTWREGVPGVWVANRAGTVVGAVQCLRLRTETPTALPFRSLDEARQTRPRHPASMVDAPESRFVRPRASVRVRGVVSAVGAVLARALAPQLRV